MNSPFLVEQSRGVLARTPEKEPEARLRALYRRIFGRAPTAGELDLGLRFVREGVAEPVVHKAGPWNYGFGEMDVAAGALKSFTPLPRFTGSAWQGGSEWPDPALGWVMLNATGGHVGNDLKHAAARRWTSPRGGKLSITGTLAHAAKEGDGIRAFVMSGTRGILASWSLHAMEAKTELKGVPVKAGETIDVVVDCRPSGNIGWDEFAWAPVIRMEAGGPAAKAEEWSASAQFAGPATVPFDAWTKYVQVLLLSNEFVVVD